MKRFLPILFLSVFLSANSFGQGGRTGPEDPGKGLKIYPNPASNMVFISFTNSVTSKTKLDLYDINGKFIKNLYEGILNKNAQRKIELQTKGLSAGVYIVTLQTENKIIGQNKLLVTN